MDMLVSGFGDRNTGVRNVSNAVAQPVLDNSGEGSIMNAITPMSPNFDPTLQAGAQPGMPSSNPMEAAMRSAQRRGMQIPQQAAQPTPQSQMPPQQPTGLLAAAVTPGQQNAPNTPTGEAERIIEALSGRLQHINKKELSALKRFQNSIDGSSGAQESKQNDYFKSLQDPDGNGAVGAIPFDAAQVAQNQQQGASAQGAMSMDQMIQVLRDAAARGDESAMGSIIENLPNNTSLKEVVDKAFPMKGM